MSNQSIKIIGDEAIFDEKLTNENDKGDEEDDQFETDDDEIETDDEIEGETDDDDKNPLVGEDILKMVTDLPPASYNTEHRFFGGNKQDTEDALKVINNWSKRGIQVPPNFDVNVLNGNIDVFCITVTRGSNYLNIGFHTTFKPSPFNYERVLNIPITNNILGNSYYRAIGFFLYKRRFKNVHKNLNKLIKYNNNIEHLALFSKKNSDSLAEIAYYTRKTDRVLFEIIKNIKNDKKILKIMLEPFNKKKTKRLT